MSEGVNASVVSLRPFTGETVHRAAIWARRFAISAFQQVNEYPRMACPEWRAGPRTLERQIVRRHRNILGCFVKLAHDDSSDSSQPVGVGRYLAIHHVEEQALDFLRDRAAMAGADLAIIEFTDRRYFRSGTGEEGFVGDVDVVARHAS